MKSEIFKSLDLFDNKEFDYVANMKAFYRIKDFKSIYKEWRQAYLKTKIQHIDISLEQYCEDTANKAKIKITPEQVKKAILMKADKHRHGEIAKVTGIAYSKLNYIFGNANMHGLLEIKEKRNENKTTTASNKIYE